MTGAEVYRWMAHHGRTQFGVRNSRIGFRFKGPETANIKSSALAEMDFLGNQPQGQPLPVAPAGSPAVSEAAYFNNPAFRVRHFMLKMETPIVDLLAGQYWELFGWQSYFHPNTVELQGVPGQIYSRTPQLRISKLVKTDAVNVEAAIAALRPLQRNSEIPDAQAGIRVLVNHLKALHTAGGTGTASTRPASASRALGARSRSRTSPRPRPPRATSRAGASRRTCFFRSSRPRP